MIINKMIAKNMFQFHGSNAHTKLTEDEGNFSNLCWVKWYDWCNFCGINLSFIENKEKLRAILGYSATPGQQISVIFLNITITVGFQSLVRHVT